MSQKSVRTIQRVISLLIVIVFIFTYIFGSAFSVSTKAAGPSEKENTRPDPPSRLTVDYLTNPSGVVKPTFAWFVNDPDNNEIQTGYQILVASSLDKLKTDIADVWDSKLVSSRAQSSIEYKGKALISNARYYWKVRTADKDGRKSKWSENAYFDTGLFKNEDWSGAQWIKGNTASSDPMYSDDYNYFRKNFTLASGKTVERASLFIAGASSWYLFVNGKSIGETSAFSYPAYQYYQSYDITRNLTDGKNNISVLLHYYGGGQGRPTGERGLISKILVTYTDGSQDVFGTDDSWKVARASQWVLQKGAASLKRRDGEGIGYVETIDSRKAINDWNSLGYDDSSWSAPTVIGPQPTPDHMWTGNLLSNQGSIQYQKISPVKMDDTGNGKYVIDFGKVYAGTPQVVIPAELNNESNAGKYITMRAGYTLASDGQVSTDSRYSTQSADMSFNYYLDGSGKALTFSPIVYLGFRYFQIDNYPGELSKDNISIIERHSILDDEASVHFNSSNDMLNKVWTIMYDSLKLGAQEGFVDTPTREKGGFLTDGANEPTSYVFGDRVMSKRVLEDFFQSQWIDGRLNSVYPNVDGMRDIPDYTQMFIPWVYDYYVQTGDAGFIRNHFDQLKKIIDYINKSKDPKTGLIFKLTGGGGSYNYGIIDWPAQMRFGYDWVRDSRSVIDGYAYMDYHVMAEFANAIGETEDEKLFKKQAADMKDSINKYLLNNDNVYIDGINVDGSASTVTSQQSQVYPLSQGIVPQEAIPTVIKKIKNQQMSLGMMNVRWLMESLGETNQGAQLIDLYTNANHYGWADLIQNKGATSTWESWNSDQYANESMSHPWGCSGMFGILDYILGVTPIKAGYEKIQVKPLDFGKSLASASGNLPTDRGQVDVSWNRTDEASKTTYTMKVTIPTNMQAKVYVPKAGIAGNSILVNGVAAEGKEEGEFLSIDNVGSGTYEFTRSGKQTLSPELKGVSTTPVKTKTKPGTTVTVNALSYDQNDSELTTQKVTWSSDQPEVASVDPETGVVTATTDGKATITVKSTLNGVTKTDTSEITVLTEELQNVVVNAPKSVLKFGDSTTVDVKSSKTNYGATADLSNAVVKYSSNHPEVAEVDEGSGLVTAKGEGTAKITATVTHDGVTKTGNTDISVDPELDKVKVNADFSGLDIHKTIPISAEALSKLGNSIDLNKASVSYSSSDENIAKVTGGRTLYLWDDYSNSSNPNFSGSGIKISDGQLMVPSGTEATLASPIDSSQWSDYTIDTDFTINDQSAGVRFRTQGSKIGYFYQISNQVVQKLPQHGSATVLALGDPELKVQVNKNSSTNTVLKEVPLKGIIDWSNFKQKHHLKIVVKGDNFTTYIDGKLVDSTTDSYSTNGGVSFKSGTNDQALFDDVMVANGKPDGALTGISDGSATITATVTYDGKTVSGSANIVLPSAR